MTVQDATPAAPAPAAGSGRAEQRAAMINRSATRLILATLVGLVLISLTRELTDEPGLTTGGALGAAINAAMPIMLAGLGGLWSERSGIVNIGLEGQMILGTWFAADFAWHSGSAWKIGRAHV